VAARRLAPPRPPAASRGAGTHFTCFTLTLLALQAASGSAGAQLQTLYAGVCCTYAERMLNACGRMLDVQLQQHPAAEALTLLALH
jgi:hypothetical protein